MEENKKVETKEIFGKKIEVEKLKKGLLALLGVLILTLGMYNYSIGEKYKSLIPRVLYQRERENKEIIKENIIIYTPSLNSENLIEEEIEVIIGENDEEKLKNVFAALKERLNYDIKYVDETNQVVEIQFFKSEIELLDVFFDGKDVYLNMNSYFKDNMKTISQEIFVIYSIVNTITENSSYKRVKFLIDGQEVEQLNFYNLSEFYERNLEI